MARAPKSRRRATIRDVAARAGVSLTTVSHALNGKGRVEAATVESIRNAAAELGYRASAAARNLRIRRTGLIAVMHSRSSVHQVSLIELEYFLRVVAGASAVASEHGLNVTLLMPTGSSEPDWQQMDGAILIDPVRGDTLLESLEQAGVAVVTTGRDTSRPIGRGAWVDNDNAHATRVVLNHLGDCGAKRVALLTTPADYSYSRETLKHYRAWCRERNQAPIDCELRGGINETIAFAATKSLFAGSSRPDAVHCVTDRYAMGAIMAIQSLGLRVPDDCLVTAGTDSDAARLMSPSLTALDLDPTRVGISAARMLVARLSGLPSPQRTIVPVELRVRQSSAPFRNSALSA